MITLRNMYQPFLCKQGLPLCATGKQIRDAWSQTPTESSSHQMPTPSSEHCPCNTTATRVEHKIYENINILLIQSVTNKQ